MSFLTSLLQAGAQVFEVGGSVRDRLLGLPQKDQDLVVLKLPFTQLIQVLKKHGRLNLVGKSFGIIKFRPRGQKKEIDIALPRIERSTGPKHRDFAIHFDENIPLEKDLGRRDFSLNAMARNLENGQLIDPFGGQADLKTKTLRQVFDNSFVEDPLRLLRAVQFAARFQLKIENKTFAAMQAHAKLIQSVSPERIIEEIGKAFKAPVPSQAFLLMQASQLLPQLFPELAQSTTKDFQQILQSLDLVASEPKLHYPKDLELFLACLFQKNSPKVTQAWLKKYKASMLGISASAIKQLIQAQDLHITSQASAATIRHFIYGVGEKLILKLLDFYLIKEKSLAENSKLAESKKFQSRVKAELAKQPPLSLKQLQINGQDLKALGYAEGPLLGKIMQELMEWVLDEVTRNKAESLKEEVKKRYPLH